MAWVATLGIQVPVPIPNFRFAPGDVLLAATVLSIALTDRRAIARAVWPVTPVTLAFAALAAAICWGLVIASARTGGLVQEAWLNKGVGLLVLGSIVVATRSLLRTPEGVRSTLRMLLTAGTVTVWVALVAGVLIPLVTGWSFPAITGGVQLRFGGLLLNPTANAVFLSVLLLVQLASVGGGRVVSWHPWVQRANAVGLTLLLFITLSRSTWFAALVAIFVMGAWMLQRERRFALLLGLIVLAFSAQPLLAVLSPALQQVGRGQAPSTLRETAPRALPTGALGEVARPLSSPTPAQTAGGISAGPRLTPTPTVAPTPVPTRDARLMAQSTPIPVGEAAVLAQQSAVDRNGATDRLALNFLALRLWLADPWTAITGIGLGVFFQITPFTQFGTNVIIHNTYLWLPVEMGLLGLCALGAVVRSGWLIGRDLWRRRRDGLVPAIAGPLVLFALWMSMNEGSYQRLFWMMLSLGSVLLWPAQNDADQRAGSR